MKYSRFECSNVCVLFTQYARLSPDFQLLVCHRSVSFSIQLNSTRPYIRFFFFHFINEKRYSTLKYVHIKKVIYSFNSNSVFKSKFPSLISPTEDRKYCKLHAFGATKCRLFGFFLSLHLSLVLAFTLT